MEGHSSVPYRSAKRFVRAAIRGAGRVQTTGSRVLRLANRELKSTVDIPLKRKLWAYRHGYVSSSVPLYDLSEENRHDYLSEWERERAREINGELALVHENKLLFHYVLQPVFPDELPTLYGYLHDGQFHSSPLSSVEYDSLQDFVDRHGALIAKPADGALGSGVRVVEQTGDGYRIDGQQSDPAKIGALVRQNDRYVVTEFCEQADYAAEIFPGAPNTIRIMTMVDPDAREPFIGALDHRFGTEKSVPVDNTAQGGLSAGVDLDTGELTEAVDLPKGRTVDRYRSHPETGASIEGVKIPGWQRIHDRLLEMAAYLAPVTPYIGWDVLVTNDDGAFVVVEANSYPDVPLQTHEPLLGDERIRRFYEYHDVVS